MFEVILTLSFKLVLSSSVNQDIVNERFVASRDYYEELWDVHCPKEVDDVPPPVEDIVLCLILDARFEQSQTCDWWRTITEKSHPPTLGDPLNRACENTR